MRPDEIKSEINKLNLSEQILLLEDVWDSIAQHNSELPLSAWQKKELDSRYESYRNNELELKDWKSVHQRLKKK